MFIRKGRRKAKSDLEATGSRGTTGGWDVIVIFPAAQQQRLRQSHLGVLGSQRAGYGGEQWWDHKLARIG